MAEPKRPAPAKPAPEPGRRTRIETQIHRRRTVKVSSPLRDEWDAEGGPRPEGLRMPPHKMKK